MDVHNLCRKGCAEVLPKKPEDQEDHEVEGFKKDEHKQVQVEELRLEGHEDAVVQVRLQEGA